MTFRDLKYPKEIARKKKLSLYKCYVLEPLKKGSPVRTIDLNMDRERFALSETLAVQHALNKMGLDNALKLIFGAVTVPDHSTEEDANISLNRSSFFVVLEVVLKNGVMDEDVLLPSNDAADYDPDPCYDMANGLLTVTVRDRYDSMHIKNYTLHDIYVSIDPGSDLLHIKELKLDEVVINSSLTGGK